MPTPFDFSLGLAQGRIASDDAPAGAYVFELGHEGGRALTDVSVGDYSEVSQTVNVQSNDLLARVTVRVVEPVETNASIAWEVVGLLDSSAFFRRRLTDKGRTLELTDLAVSLAAGGGASTLAFRLEAVTP
jgi:hypothetical protein